MGLLFAEPRKTVGSGGSTKSLCVQSGIPVRRPSGSDPRGKLWVRAKSELGTGIETHQHTMVFPGEE